MGYQLFLQPWPGTGEPSRRGTEPPVHRYPIHWLSVLGALRIHVKRALAYTRGPSGAGAAAGSSDAAAASAASARASSPAASPAPSAPPSDFCGGRSGSSAGASPRPLGGESSVGSADWTPPTDSSSSLQPPTAQARAHRRIAAAGPAETTPAGSRTNAARRESSAWTSSTAAAMDPTGRNSTPRDPRGGRRRTPRLTPRGGSDTGRT